jgi:hypothetical protein
MSNFATLQAKYDDSEAVYRRQIDRLMAEIDQLRIEKSMPELKFPTVEVFIIRFPHFLPYLPVYSHNVKLRLGAESSNL